jgi:hypothetical protein
MNLAVVVVVGLVYLEWGLQHCLLRVVPRVAEPVFDRIHARN